MRLPLSVNLSKRILIACFGAFVIPMLSARVFAQSAEQTLYRFQGGKDGMYPYSSLIADTTGSLYGTTNNGGGSTRCANGCGTVFQLSAPAELGDAWTETVLYRFQGGSDGSNPETPLVVDAKGNLYGTTSEGGSGNCVVIGLTGCGTAFELSPPGQGMTWTYRQLYSFRGVPSGRGEGDGAWPAGLAFGRDGNLYGFAYAGGYCETDDDGYVFCGGAAFVLKAFEGAWAESVIYRFNGPYYPYAGPNFDEAGNLYGAGPGGIYGYGAIFRLEPQKKWEQTGIYDFHGTTGDGAFPNFGLVFDVAGNLYASTLGTSGSYPNVIKVSPTQSGEWNENVLFQFYPVGEGDTPLWGPILGKNGDLYGTTQEGGQNDAGLVYQLVPATGKSDWTQNILYDFSLGINGFAPSIGLTFGQFGALYGATTSGGDASCGVNGDGCGVIYRVMP